MFEPTEIELGTLRIGKSVTFNFKYTEEVYLITNIEVPCGCTAVTNNIPLRIIEVVYTPTDIPIHLKRQGQYWYNSIKMIKLDYLNTSGANLKQNLIFTAKIVSR